MQASISLIHRIFDLAFNQGDLDVIDELVAEKDVNQVFRWGMPAGRLGLKQLITAYRIGFPDLHCTIEDEIDIGDRSAVIWTMRGTHEGLFMGNPPTGRQVEIRGIIFARTANGRIIEDWTLVDQMGTLQQLGIVPPSSGH
jgi:steroid delta-isomerase-like uncharacterized protein